MQEQAGALMRGLDTARAAARIAAAVRTLTALGREVATMGFTMDRRLALDAAQRNRDVVGTVI